MTTTTATDTTGYSSACRIGDHPGCTAGRCWCPCHPFRCSCGRVEPTLEALQRHRSSAGHLADERATSEAPPDATPEIDIPVVRRDLPIAPEVLADGRHVYDLPPIEPTVSVSSARKYPCDVDGCERRFATPQALGAHTRAHRRAAPTDASERDLADAAPVRRFVCISCDWVTRASTQEDGVAALAAHVAAEHPSYDCPDCGGSWETADALAAHVALHEASAVDPATLEAACPECGETIVGGGDPMAAHILTEHPPGATTDVATQHDRYFTLLRDLYGKTADPALLDRMERLALAVERRETTPGWRAMTWFGDHDDPIDPAALDGRRIGHGFSGGSTKITYGRSTTIEIQVGADDILTLPHEGRRALFALLDLISQTIGDDWRMRLRTEITDNLRTAT